MTSIMTQNGRDRKRALTLAAAFSLLALFSALPAGKAAPVPNRHLPQVAWSFDLRHDRSLVPHCTVFLRVNGRRILILRAEDEFQLLGKTEYKNWGIPAIALTACAGQGIGEGDVLYVVRRAHSLVVFRREEDEQAPVFPWKRLKVIPLR